MFHMHGRAAWMPRAPINACLCVCAGIQLCIGAVWRSDWLDQMSGSDDGILCADDIEANLNLTLLARARVVRMMTAYTHECCWEDDDNDSSRRWDINQDAINTTTS